MLRFLFCTCLLLITAQSYAQGDQAIGVRLGLTPGFEYRMYTDGANSYKFLLGTRDRGVQLHLLKEFHQHDLTNISNQLVLFYGLGVHVGYERWDEFYLPHNPYVYETRTAFLAGVDGIIGWEYHFYEVPVSLGLELKPFMEVLGREIFDIELFDFAFTVKYLF